MDYNIQPKLVAYCIGSKTFARDDNADFRTIPIREQIHQKGRRMLDLQQRIWELNEEIRISQGNEQADYVNQQNELRKEYAALRNEKEGLESGKIKPEPFKLEGYTLNDNGFYVPKMDQIRDLEF